MRKQNPNIGSTLNDFLTEDGLLAECQATAIKRVIAWQVAEHLKATKTTKTDFAETLGTSRAQINRLLDPDNTSLNLQTLSKVSAAMGKRLEITLM